jgi:hypothetical protein
MNRKRIIQTFASVVALLPTLALAAPQINGTLGFIPFGASASFAGTNLTSATSFSFAASVGTGITGEDINTIGSATYNGLPNDFYLANGIWQLGIGSQPATSSYSVYQSGTALNIGSGGAITNGTITDFFGFGYVGAGQPANRFQFDLYSATKGMNGTTSLTLSGTGILRDTQGVFANTAAKFTLSTVGTATAVNNYSVSFSTVPVPEPETYAMMLAGIGLMGFMARRRKQQQTA